MKKIIALLLVAAAVLGLAGCKNGGHNQNSTDLRVLNAVADAEPLDVLVSDDVKASAVPLNGTSGFVNFNSGSQDTKIRSSTSQSILLEQTLGYASGVRNTLLLYGKRSAMATLLLPEDATSPSSSSKVRVRVVNLSPDAGPVDLYLTTGDISTGGAVVSSASIGTVTNAGEVNGGTYKIFVTAAGTQDILFQSTATYNFTGGNDTTVVIMPALGGRLVNVDVLEQGASGASTFLANGQSRMRAVNGIVDGAVNFKVDGTTVLTSVPFTGNSSYIPVASGTHTLAIDAANAPGTSIASISASLIGARDYTLLSYGRISSPSLVALLDDNSLPASNFVRIRFVNALSDGSNVDVLLNFAGQAAGIAPGKASSYYTVAAGTNYTVSFTTPGGVTVIASLSGIEMDSQQVYTAYVFGTAASAQVKLVRDR